MTSTVGPGHLADGRVHRPRLLRRDPGGDLRRPARRPVHRPADAHRAGRHRLRRRPVARRHAATSCCCRPPSTSASTMAQRRLRPRRALPDARLRHERSRPRHEQLDVRSVRVSRRSRSIAARCSTPRRWSGSATGAATRTSTATAFRYRTLPGTGMPAYFTRGTGHNEKAHYSERPDDYVNNVDRLTRKFETARDARAARRSSTCARRARSASSPTARRTGRSRRAAISWSREAGLETDYLRLRAYPFTQAVGDVHRRPRPRLRRRAEPRRADARPAAAGAERRAHRQAAQRAALQRPAARRAHGDRRHPRAGRRRTPPSAPTSAKHGALGGE